MPPIYTSREEAAREMKKHHEQIKYHAARYVWKKRRETVPRKKISWHAWWDKMFKDDLLDYAVRNKKN